jgi:hypothetical protein
MGSDVSAVGCSTGGWAQLVRLLLLLANMLSLTGSNDNRLAALPALPATCAAWACVPATTGTS